MAVGIGGRMLWRRFAHKHRSIEIRAPQHIKLNSNSSSADLSMSSSSKSSGSEGALAMDDKKRKRMESNRESAMRSRQRKQSHLGDLVRQVAILQSQNGEFSGKEAEISRSFGAVEAANAVLSAEKEWLSRRLESLESVIENDA